MPLELADAALPGVAADDLHHGLVGERHLLVAQAGLGELPRDEVRLGDLGLLALGVAREVDHLHPVEQRGRDVLEEVGRGDEQDLAQVERHVQVMVRERVVLGRVEHLQQGAGGVALIATPSLSTSSSRKTGFLVPACLSPWMIRPGMAPT